ncbi:peptidase M16 family protein [Asanoa ferruginea]|uniref:insulinase family protein n=1 Tax=Asanoa ferruginea TaxID=53367 RepID=UPI0011C0D8D7|nr:insulinase family protein [Asanoa ferruginea]
MSHVEVDGVPTLVAPTVGPARAGLVFRVGQADETLARRGLTHLVEHLVLHPLGGSTYHHNGSTGQTTTTFYVQGGGDDLVDFFARVCRSLAEPDVGRLAMERDVLRTEATGRGSGPARDLPLWRYGARGYGLLSYPEWGLSALTADEVLEWIATHFTRENAVLWIAGDGVPDGLRLDLPHGRRQPLPAVTSALPTTPAFFNGGGPATAVHAVVPEAPAGIVYAHLLQRRLHRALRLDTGLSYTTAVEYVERGDGQATVTAYADALVDKQDAVLGGFVDVLAGLRATPVAGTELATAATTAALEAGGTDAAAQGLPGQAFRLLTGRPLVDVDAQVAALRAVTAADVHATAKQAHASALLMTPPGGAEWAGYTPAPTTSRTRAGGRGHVPTAGGGPVIHLGADGVSAVDPDGNVATVRYDEIAVVLGHPDGSRLLIGNDGIVVAVDVDRYPDLNAAQLDRRVPPGLLVALPGPPPPASATPNLGARWARRLTPGWLRLGALGLVTAVVGGAALAYTVGMVFGLVAQVRVLGVIGGWVIAGWFGRAFLRAWTAERARA